MVRPVFGHAPAPLHHPSSPSLPLYPSLTPLRIHPTPSDITIASLYIPIPLSRHHSHSHLSLTQTQTHIQLEFLFLFFSHFFPCSFSSFLLLSCSLFRSPFESVTGYRSRWCVSPSLPIRYTCLPCALESTSLSLRVSSKLYKWIGSGVNLWGEVGCESCSCIRRQQFTGLSSP